MQEGPAEEAQESNKTEGDDHFKEHESPIATKTIDEASPVIGLYQWPPRFLTEASYSFTQIFSFLQPVKRSVSACC